MSKIVTIKETAIAITIIALVPAPTHIIIIGPNATLGKLFNTTKNGSETFEMKGDHHNIIAVITPRIDPNKKEIHTIMKDAYVFMKYYADGSEGWCFSL